MQGTLRQVEDGRWQLRFVRELEHPTERVWRAITEPEHLAHWFPTTIEGERTPGASLRFTLDKGQMPPFEGEMLAYEPPSLMELRWGPDIVRIELERTEQGTRLTLLDTLIERGKGARDGAGWHLCLDTLVAYLGQEGDSDQAMASWEDLHRDYVADFGPEAATIGRPDLG
jgi:uncharacterized protein YndB with AHSA1/START domain